MTIATVTGHYDLHWMADQQAGPTCLFEALEKIILMFRPDKGTDLVEKELIGKAAMYGGLIKRPFIETERGRFEPGATASTPVFAALYLATMEFPLPLSGRTC
jgi:hypothetical protein